MIYCVSRMVFFAATKQHVDYIRFVALNVILNPRKTAAHLEQMLQCDQPAIIVLPQSNTCWCLNIEQSIHLRHPDKRMSY